ncbi:MAG: pseudouridine-5'-phosphate glycosidase [Bacillota bacterium]
METLMKIHPKVKAALEENRPVVALESTIISHGMPYPDNVEMAKRVEAIIEEEDAVPATIAMIDGVLRVGLDNDEIDRFAKRDDVIKLSKRDIAYAAAHKQNGATTVSATMLVAEMAGITFFATGGIGGVHREADTTFDISRDLEELSEVDVTVVCAGAKSILDLGLTLEYLETKGVPILGYQTDELPAFYTRKSGHALHHRVDSPEKVAAVVQKKRALKLKGGMVIANPVPKESEVDKETIDSAINQALLNAKEEGVKGKGMTPYLLASIEKITKGKSLEANLALVYNNARLAARAARAYQALKDAS